MFEIYSRRGDGLIRAATRRAEIAEIPGVLSGLYHAPPGVRRLIDYSRSGLMQLSSVARATTDNAKFSTEEAFRFPSEN